MRCRLGETRGSVNETSVNNRFIYFHPSTPAGYRVVSDTGNAVLPSLGDRGGGYLCCGVRHHSGELVQPAGGLPAAPRNERDINTHWYSFPQSMPLRGQNSTESFRQVLSGRERGGETPLTLTNSLSQNHGTLCHRTHPPQIHFPHAHSVRNGS